MPDRLTVGRGALNPEVSGSNPTLAAKISMGGEGVGLYKRGRGRIWWMSYMEDGKQRCVSTGETNKRVAGRILAIKKGEIIREKYGLWGSPAVPEPVQETRRRTYSVYFLQAESGGLIKIGESTRVENRLLELSKACPMKLKVLVTAPGRDKPLHEKFGKYREHGEWFRPEEELTTFIDSLKENSSRQVGERDITRAS